MVWRGSRTIRTHDLLEIDMRDFSVAPDAPEWVGDCLRSTPFAVVRRGSATEAHVPVGVRGTDRNHRWATYCSVQSVTRMISPSELRLRTTEVSRVGAVPALQALQIVEGRWIDLDLPWGPGGSVGFELATGHPTVGPQSDLDIVIRAEKRMPLAMAKYLFRSVHNLPAAADIRIETPVYSFSLGEYCNQGSAPILLRAPDGVILGSNPWEISSQGVDSRLAGLR